MLYSNETVEAAMNIMLKKCFSVGKITENGYVCGGIPQKTEEAK